MAAGMDAYTSKPVSPQALTKAMSQAIDISTHWQPTRPTPMLADIEPVTHHHTTAAPPRTGKGIHLPPPIHIDKLRHRLDGDHVALARLAQHTQRQLAQHVEALTTALAAQNTVVATTSAHALKTALATITAERASALSNGLEMAARKGEWALFGRALSVLKNEIDRLDQALSALDA
jgi:HPt (histidine-containing phosphotransfer) domain-containing protein